MQKNLARDRRAEVLGLPLSLVISLIVCAAVIPAVAVEAGRAMESGALSEARSECQRIGGAARAVYLAGAGTTVRLDVHIPSGRWGVDGVRLGDGPGGPYASCARIDQNGRETLVAFDAPLCAGGGPLDVGPGGHTVVLKHVDDARFGARVEASLA